MGAENEALLSAAAAGPSALCFEETASFLPFRAFLTTGVWLLHLKWEIDGAGGDPEGICFGNL